MKHKWDLSVRPTKCECGCTRQVKRNVTSQEGLVAAEYTLHCAACGSYLGSYSYGKWTYER